MLLRILCEGRTLNVELVLALRALLRGPWRARRTQHTRKTKTQKKKEKIQKEKKGGYPLDKLSIFYLVKVNTLDVGRMCCKTKVVG